MKRPEHYRLWIRNAAAALVIVLALANLAKLLGRYPYFELATHFPIQYACGFLMALVVLTTIRSRWAIAALIGLVLNAVQLWPYLAASPADPDLGTPVKVMVLNVYHPGHDVDSVIRTIEEASPDIVTLQEVTWPWWEALRPRLLSYPYVKAEPGPAGSGIVLLSRHPLERAEVVRFTSWTQPAILAVAVVGDQRISLLCMHPHKPTRLVNFGARNRQLKAAGEMMAAVEGPRVLMGDLNCTPWSPYFSDLIEQSGLRDTRVGRGLLPSWPLPMPSFGRIPIDHILVSPEISVRSLQTSTSTGSDHCALIAEVELK